MVARTRTYSCDFPAAVDVSLFNAPQSTIRGLRSSFGVAASAVKPFFVSLAFAALVACHRGDAVTTARNLDAEFSANVPPGSTKENVMVFLTSRGIAAYEDRRARIVTASLTGIEKGLLTRAGVYMTFHFDEAGRLTTHEIRAIATGP